MSPRKKGSAAAPTGVPESAERLFLEGRSLAAIARRLDVPDHRLRAAARRDRWAARRRLARDLVEFEQAQALASEAARALLQAIDAGATPPALASAASRLGTLAHRLAGAALWVDRSRSDLDT